MQVQIFVEGDSDKKFIEDYLTFIGSKAISADIIVNGIGGITKLEISKPIFRTNHIEGIQNVLILDSDNLFSERKIEIEEFIQTLGFEMPFFLFPNHQHNGDLETLLENIIPADNQELFDCWDGYIQCLESKNKDYSTPNRKSKIYAYLEALLGKSRRQKKMIEENSRNYLELSHWNLNSTYLEPLKRFLTSIK